LRIDFHSHYYPPRYLKELESLKEGLIRIENDESGQRQIIMWNTRIPIKREMWDLETQLSDMNKYGLDMKVLSPANPWDALLEPEREASIIRIINEEIAWAVKKYPEKFIGLATLPYRNVEMALDEMDKAIINLGLKGLIMGTNIGGKSIDAPEFWPIYEKAERLDVPILVHPFMPRWLEGMLEYQLIPLMALPFETTLAIARLTLAGILEKYPNLKFVAAHLGGTLPYLLGRIDRGYMMYPECKVNITKPPSEYLKGIYLDTVSLHSPSLLCAYSYWGAEKLLFGTDYPYEWGTFEVIKSIQELELSREEDKKILGENANKLLFRISPCDKPTRENI
jgi:aminocarboxymuconate-semialdehyde decarboxylase